MTCRKFSFAVAVLVGFGSWTPVPAQSVFNPSPPVAPYSRPALSPYLNLLRGGDPASNYYLGVLTEYDRRYQLSRPILSQDPSYLDPGLDDRSDLDIPERQLPTTGHPAGFMIYNGYYNMPNNRGFIPYNPNMNNRQQLRR